MTPSVTEFMGIYDREYYQDERRSTWNSGNRSWVTTLIVMNGVIALLDLFSPQIEGGGGRTSRWLTYHMAAPENVLLQPWNYWKLLTAGFAHESLSNPNGIWHVTLNMYSLWLFGRAVEQRYGGREFIQVYLGLIVLTTLLWAVLESTVADPTTTYLVGASGAVTGITILYILNFPHHRFQLLFPPMPVSAWVLGLMLVAFDLLGALSSRGSSVAFTAHLAGAALAYLYFWSGLRLSDWTAGFRLPWFSGRPKLRVHREANETRNLERTADEILAKLHDRGADSLTARERKILEEYSRSIREKGGR